MVPEQRKVEFQSGEVTIRGILQLPAGPGPHAIVIMAHGLGGLKEWANIPAVSAAIVEAGIATLAFDYRNFGDSDGSPREEVDHLGEVDDYCDAISFASALPEIDADRIGIWGTSLGGRNVLAVAARETRVKCVVSQVPAVAGRPETAAYATGHNGDVEALYRDLEEDLRNREAGGEPKYIYFPEATPADQHYEHFQAFGEDQTRNWKRRITLQTYNRKNFFDVTDMIPEIAPAALRFILVDHDYACPMSVAAKLFDMAQEPKSMVVFPGHHYTPYTTWKPDAARAARDWFVEHLQN